MISRSILWLLQNSAVEEKVATCCCFVREKPADIHRQTAVCANKAKTHTSHFDISPDGHSTSNMMEFYWGWCERILTAVINFFHCSLHHSLVWRFPSGLDEAIPILMLFLSLIFWLHQTLKEFSLLMIRKIHLYHFLYNASLLKIIISFYHLPYYCNQGPYHLTPVI